MHVQIFLTGYLGEKKKPQNDCFKREYDSPAFKLNKCKQMATPQMI